MSVWRREPNRVLWPPPPIGRAWQPPPGEPPPYEPPPGSVSPEVRAEWRRELFTTGHWLYTGAPPVGGGSLARRVFHDADGVRFFGWRKPVVQPRDSLDKSKHAAKEKLCSDLGWELGAPVAPVLLLPQTDAPAPECVSLECYAQHSRHNGARMRGGVWEFLPRPPPALLVFWTWVGCGDGPNNTLVGGPGDPGELVAFDFGNCALGGGDAPTRPPTRLPRGCAEALERLRALPAELIEQAVTRIPEPWLDPATAARIVRDLLNRREAMRCLPR